MTDKAAILDQVRDRLAAVEQRLTAACGRAGRERSAVTLVAVTKTISVELALNELMGQHTYSGSTPSR